MVARIVGVLIGLLVFTGTVVLALWIIRRVKFAAKLAGLFPPAGGAAAAGAVAVPGGPVAASVEDEVV